MVAAVGLESMAPIPPDLPTEFSKIMKISSNVFGGEGQTERMVIS
jgi:hypothetical protein